MMNGQFICEVRSKLGYAPIEVGHHFGANEVFSIGFLPPFLVLKYIMEG